MSQGQGLLHEGVKLTKKFFGGLPDGVFLVSCVGMSPPEPSFAEYVAASTARQEQWNRICDTGADQRHCDVYGSKEQFEEWLKGWQRRPDGKWVRMV